MSSSNGSLNVSEALDLKLDHFNLFHYPENDPMSNEPAHRSFSFDDNSGDGVGTLGHGRSENETEDSGRLVNHGVVSQNPSVASGKVRGQDVMSVTRHQGYSLNILCDGHDTDGFLVAALVCSVLPKLIFAGLAKVKPSNSILDGTAIEDGREVIVEAFEACQEICGFEAQTEEQQKKISEVILNANESIDAQANNNAGSHRSGESLTHSLEHTHTGHGKLLKGKRCLGISGKYKGKILELCENYVEGEDEVVVKLINIEPATHQPTDTYEDYHEDLSFKSGSVKDMYSIPDQSPMSTDGASIEEKDSTFRVDKKEVRVVSWEGGCTCVCFLMHDATRKARVVALGDSRAMIIPPIGSALNDSLAEFFVEDHLHKDPSPMKKQSSAKGFLTVHQAVPCDRELSSLDRSTSFFKVSNPPRQKPTEIDTTQQYAWCTAPHHWSNKIEATRIKSYYSGRFEIRKEDNEVVVLVQPETKDTVEPTRGFGDIEMLGTGYIAIPQVSHVFEVPKGTLIVLGSDGIFDYDLWNEDALTYQLASWRHDHKLDLEDMNSSCAKTATEKLSHVADTLYRETLSLAYDYYEYSSIDDISLLCSYVL